MDQLVDRARAAEAAGFGGIASMDHMAPPAAESSPMFEAMITNAWLAGRTDRLRVGSLVLCDSFRHPAVLAREAVSLDHASGGRFELGIGWGSVSKELTTFGIGSAEPKARLSRLRESLEIITALWAGETLDYEGEHFTPARGGSSSRAPSGRSRSPSAAPARERCDWSLRMRTGGTCTSASSTSSRRCGRSRETRGARSRFRSPSSRPRARARRSHRRRTGASGRIPIVGTADELVDYFGSLSERGVERVYVWFCDFAPPETLAAFGETVIGQLGRTT